MAILIGGKVRAKIKTAKDTAEEEIRQTALKEPSILPFLEGKKVKQVIVVPGRMVNIVVG